MTTVRCHRTYNVERLTIRCHDRNSGRPLRTLEPLATVKLFLPLRYDYLRTMGTLQRKAKHGDVDTRLRLSEE